MYPCQETDEYTKDPIDKKKWIVDEEAAEVIGGEIRNRKLKKVPEGRPPSVPEESNFDFRDLSSPAFQMPVSDPARELTLRSP